MQAIFGIVPISNLMWTLLLLGMIGAVIYGVIGSIFYWFKNR